MYNALSGFYENQGLVSRFSRVRALCTGSEVSSVQQQNDLNAPDFLTARLEGVKREALQSCHPLTWSLLGLLPPSEDFLPESSSRSVPSLLESSLPCPTPEWKAHPDNAHTRLGQLRSTRICCIMQIQVDNTPLWSSQLLGPVAASWE